MNVRLCLASVVAAGLAAAPAYADDEGV